MSYLSALENHPSKAIDVTIVVIAQTRQEVRTFNMSYSVQASAFLTFLDTKKNFNIY